MLLPVTEVIVSITTERLILRTKTNPLSSSRRRLRAGPPPSHWWRCDYWYLPMLLRDSVTRRAKLNGFLQKTMFVFTTTNWRKESYNQGGGHVLTHNSVAGPEGPADPIARKRAGRRSCPTDLPLAPLSGNEETYHRLFIRVIILGLYSNQVTQVTITDLTIITL